MKATDEAKITGLADALEDLARHWARYELAARPPRASFYVQQLLHTVDSHITGTRPPHYDRNLWGFLDPTAPSSASAPSAAAALAKELRHEARRWHHESQVAGYLIGCADRIEGGAL